jgi:hypothetical protein
MRREDDVLTCLKRAHNVVIEILALALVDNRDWLVAGRTANRLVERFTMELADL